MAGRQAAPAIGRSGRRSSRPIVGSASGHLRRLPPSLSCDISCGGRPGPGASGGGLPRGRGFRAPGSATETWLGGVTLGQWLSLSLPLLLPRLVARMRGGPTTSPLLSPWKGRTSRKRWFPCKDRNGGGEMSALSVCVSPPLQNFSFKAEQRSAGEVLVALERPPVRKGVSLLMLPSGLDRPPPLQRSPW